MTNPQSKLARLKELTEKARTVNPWVEVSDIREDWSADDAAFIVACDPDTVRELLQAAERGMEWRELAEKIGRLGCFDSLSGHRSTNRRDHSAACNMVREALEGSET